MSSCENVELRNKAENWFRAFGVKPSSILIEATSERLFVNDNTRRANNKVDTSRILFCKDRPLEAIFAEKDLSLYRRLEGLVRTEAGSFRRRNYRPPSLCIMSQAH